MKNTKIEWAHHTLNFWWGCAKVSEACRFCYAETLAARWRNSEVQWVPNGHRWIRHKALDEARWLNEVSRRAGGGQRIFVNSMSDTFEDHPELVTAREAALFTIAKLNDANWLLLTKRPENVRRMVPLSWLEEWPPHVWIGTTVENQEAADKRIPELLQIPAKVRFLSMEPLMGPVDLREWIGFLPTTQFSEARGIASLHWVISGGESGREARPSHPDWFRSLRDQCAAAGVPFHFKQWGEWVGMDRLGKAKAGRLLDGVEHNGVPE